MVSGPVIEVVKGGLIVDIGLRGFLPASLVELRRVRELQPYVGKVIEAKIIELDRNRNNVVLSRRAWLEEAQKEQRGDFLQNLKPGERRKGVVSSVVNFGAFVDLGGMDGLVHVSELSWKHVDHPSSVVSVGDEIEVEVLDVDLDKERISLSLKATQSDPWQEFADSHAVGQLVYGRITKLVPFGAFVQVGDGIEGLVHISEMAVHHVDLPEQVVTPGEELWVKIIDIDLQRRRISLSIKQAAEGGEVSEEYREAFGEHAYDEEGNYIGFDYAEGEFTPETEAQAAWADFAEEIGTPVHHPEAEAEGRRPRPGRVPRRPRPPAADDGAPSRPPRQPAAEPPSRRPSRRRPHQPPSRRRRADEPGPAGSRGRHRALTVPGAPATCGAVVLGAAVLLAACSSGPDTATTSTSTTAASTTSSTAPATTTTSSPTSTTISGVPTPFVPMQTATGGEFLSPSGNISCEVDFSPTTEGALCLTLSPPRSVNMTVDGTLTQCVGVQCLSNAGLDTPTLAYGTQTGVGPFRCVSATTGITCTVTSGKGFTINTAGITPVG